jgi:hypothetical protein
VLNAKLKIREDGIVLQINHKISIRAISLCLVCNQLSIIVTILEIITEKEERFILASQF